MSGFLQRALCRHGDDIPTARQHNAVLDHLAANRLLHPVEVQTDAAPMPHPWRVQASRFEETQFSTLSPDTTWRLDLEPGYVNDAPATILYQRKNDPRGWQIPSTYVEPSNPDPGFVERDLLDDPDDPPFLVIPDPPPAATASANPSASAWTQIADDQRFFLENGAFCSDSDWQLELWRAHVILSAAPLAVTALNPKLPAPRLNRYRLYTQAALPSFLFGTAAGGWRELATLYLLRDPSNPNGSADIRILQREFYDLWGMIITPGSALLSLPGSGSIVGDVGAGTFTDFWSV